MMNSNYEKESKKRNSNQEEEDGQPENYLDWLPHEVALDIISRLPIKSLIQSRFVCKSWQNLSLDPQLVRLHLSRALKGNPYFIFHCDFPIKNLLYFVEFSGIHDDDNQEKIRKIDPPFSDAMPEFTVIGSCNGILCLENSLFDDSLYLYNPFTRDYKELPKTIVFQEQEVMYGFGFHPISNQYKLIKIVYFAKKFDLEKKSYRNIRININRCVESDVQVFCLGSNRWRSIGKAAYQLDRKSTAILLNGRLHWTTNYGRFSGSPSRIVVSLDLFDERFREVPGPELSNRTSKRHYHIAVLGGCLCVAVPLAADFGTLDIWIMKEYDRKESWVKEIRIGIYSPDLRTRELQRSHSIWRNVLGGRLVRVLCLVKNGEILLEYKGGALVSYNPESGIFKNVVFPGLPYPVNTMVHVGSLSAVDAPEFAG